MFGSKRKLVLTVNGKAVELAGAGRKGLKARFERLVIWLAGLAWLALFARVGATQMGMWP